MGAVCRIAQYFPKTVDCFFERQFVVDEGVVRPEALAEVLPRDDFPRPFQQGLEDLKGLARKFLPHASFANLTGSQVHFKHAESYYLRRTGASGDSWLRLGAGITWLKFSTSHIIGDERLKKNLRQLPPANQRLPVEPTNHRQGS